MVHTVWTMTTIEILISTIDRYFGNLKTFVEWLYSDCGSGIQILSRIEQRQKRIHEIKITIQDHVLKVTTEKPWSSIPSNSVSRRPGHHHRYLFN